MRAFGFQGEVARFLEAGYRQQSGRGWSPLVMLIVGFPVWILGFYGWQGGTRMFRTILSCYRDVKGRAQVLVADWWLKDSWLIGGS